MGLSKDITLTVKDYSIILDKEIKFYEYDTINLCFSILDYGVIVKDGVVINKLMPINAMSAYMLIETPDGTDHAKPTDIEDNRIIFRLGNKYSRFIGVGKMQIVIKDWDGCRVTLPEFNFEIRESINSGWDNSVEIISTEKSELIVDEDGNPIELIKMSEMEEATELPQNSYSMIVSDGANKKIKTDLITKEVNDKLDELYQMVSDAKTLIANAITDKGVPTSGEDSFQTMAENILLIKTDNE